MMKKLFIFSSFLILIMSSAHAINCNLDIFKINKDKSQFKEILKVFPTRQAMEDIEVTNFPIEYYCGDSEANGTIISIFFMKDKVVRIIYGNSIGKERALFNIANEKYKIGFKENQKLINAKEPENYAIKKNKIYYLYGRKIGKNENEGKVFEVLEFADIETEEIIAEKMRKIEENETNN